MNNKIYNISINKLHPFENQPYKVLDNEEMDALVDSIQENGVLSPLLVRALENGEYEVISGHRRLRACEKAELKTAPVIISDMSQDEAAIKLVDSNLHRENILPSEKAKAYKLKYDALKHQGRTLGQVVPKSEENRTASEIGEPLGESYKTVQRYIRLTNLIPELLDLVDKERIALTPAVELSYLSEDEQRSLFTTIESEDRTPSLSQAQRMKKLSQSSELDMDAIYTIMTESKANEAQKVIFKYDELKRYFPAHYTPNDIQNSVIRLIQHDFERKQRERGERDER